MLTYRTTPLHNGFSPGELLMGRKLRTTLPMLSSQLEPSISDYSHLLQIKRSQSSEQSKSRIMIHTIVLEI